MRTLQHNQHNQANLSLQIHNVIVQSQYRLLCLFSNIFATCFLHFSLASWSHAWPSLSFGVTPFLMHETPLAKLPLPASIEDIHQAAFPGSGDALIGINFNSGHLHHCTCIPIPGCAGPSGIPGPGPMQGPPMEGPPMHAPGPMLGPGGMPGPCQANKFQSRNGFCQAKQSKAMRISCPACRSALADHQAFPESWTHVPNRELIDVRMVRNVHKGLPHVALPVGLPCHLHSPAS